jgi:hypothetical protein
LRKRAAEAAEALRIRRGVQDRSAAVRAGTLALGHALEASAAARGIEAMLGQSALLAASAQAAQAHMDESDEEEAVMLLLAA